MRYLFNPFAGSLERQGWWLSMLGAFGVATLFAFVVMLFNVDWSAGSERSTNFVTPGVTIGTYAVTIYLHFAICMNRLRDSGRSGFWFLAFQIPLIGPLLMIYFCGIEKGESNREEPNHADVFGDAAGEVPVARRTPRPMAPAVATHRAPAASSVPRTPRAGPQKLFGANRAARA